MSLSRRDLISTAIGLTAAAALSGTALAAMHGARWKRPEPDELDDQNIKPADKKLKILILGGTAFTGPHLVRLALARGHSVTVFNRGRTEKRIGPLPEGVERLVGDRDPKKDDGLKALEGDRKWDVVIDTSGQIPRHVRASAELLAGRAGQYIYISSISAYKMPVPPDATESAPVAELADPFTEDMGRNFENYGGLKAACEAAAEKAMPGRVANVRPGLIVGPGDGTDRFTYWPARFARQGKGDWGQEILCPGDGKDPIQFIDVRDLAAFLLRLAETNTNGVYNAIGPDPAVTMGDLAAACQKASKTDQKLVWVDAAFLEGEQVSPWGDMPVWIPREGDGAGMCSINFQKSRKAGLRSRPLDVTVRDTMAWFPKEIERRKRVTKELVEQAAKDGKPAPQLGDPEVLRAGIKPEREKEVLAAWAKRDVKDEKAPKS